MKKNFKLVLALVLSIMMVLGSMNALADAAIKVGAPLEGYSNDSSAEKGETKPVDLSDHTFNAYNILNATGVDEGTFTGLTWGSAIDDPAALLAALQGNTTLADDFADVTPFTAPAFAKAIKDYNTAKAMVLADVLKDYCVNGSKTATPVKKGETTTLPVPGYYLVDDTTETAGAVMNPVVLFAADGETAEINIKAEEPTVDKKIDSDKDQDATLDGMTEYNTGSIGEDVPYEISSTVPNTTFYKYYTMIFNDTLSKGLTFNDDLKVTVGGTELAATDYIFTKDEDLADGLPTKDTTFKLVLKDMKGNDGKKVVVTYTAKVNKNAVINGIGNPNTVTMQYSRNPDTAKEYAPGDEDDDDIFGETPEENTTTYVAEVELLKVDANTKDALAGAQFTLTGTRVKVVKTTSEQFVEDAAGTYYKLVDGTYTETAATELTQDKYDDTSKKYKKETVVEYKGVGQDETSVTLVTGSDGTLKFTGLGAGEYTLTEDKAPAGYNALEKPITFKIDWKVSGGQVDPATGENHKTEEVTFSLTDVEGATADKDGAMKFTVENKNGATLPSTGGIGTTIFYVAGTILVLAAAVLLVTKRRMNAND